MNLFSCLGKFSFGKQARCSKLFWLLMRMLADPKSRSQKNLQKQAMPSTGKKPKVQSVNRHQWKTHAMGSILQQLKVPGRKCKCDPFNVHVAFMKNWNNLSDDRSNDEYWVHHCVIIEFKCDISVSLSVQFTDFAQWAKMLTELSSVKNLNSVKHLHLICLSPSFATDSHSWSLRKCILKHSVTSKHKWEEILNKLINECNSNSVSKASQWVQLSARFALGQQCSEVLTHDTGQSTFNVASWTLSIPGISDHQSWLDSWLLFWCS